jgi:hypothetical protein
MGHDAQLERPYALCCMLSGIVWPRRCPEHADDLPAELDDGVLEGILICGRYFHQCLLACVGTKIGSRGNMTARPVTQNPNQAICSHATAALWSLAHWPQWYIAGPFPPSSKFQLCNILDCHIGLLAHCFYRLRFQAAFLSAVSGQPLKSFR